MQHPGTSMPAAPNGVSSSAAPGEGSALGQSFTQHVIDSCGPKTSPRLRVVMASLIQHVHDFAREVELTVDEWMMGVQMINWAGQMSTDKRNEGQLLCDVIGLESLVDDMTFRADSSNLNPRTLSAILGPFWRTDTPVRQNEDNISFDTPKDGVPVYLHGIVKSADTGEPIPGATVDVWQASTNGLYEQQDSNQQEFNLRGKFVTDDSGRYAFYCLKPTPYPVPNDGPAGKLLGLLDRHVYRPAHIHFMVTTEKYNPLVTQLFDSDSDYIDNDSVFAVKNDLQVTFTPLRENRKAEWELEYDILLTQK